MIGKTAELTVTAGAMSAGGAGTKGVGDGVGASVGTIVGGALDGAATEEARRLGLGVVAAGAHAARNTTSARHTRRTERRYPVSASQRIRLAFG